MTWSGESCTTPPMSKITAAIAFMADLLEHSRFAATLARREQKSMDNARPFAGIEVVEFGQFIAVPFCAQLLSEGGAHVIKIEGLEGDPVRQLTPLPGGDTRHFLSRNRGKRSLPLDLRHPRAKAVIDALLARADVVLTNFRPGLAEEFGLDAATLAPRFPRLVVGNVSAFGRQGPDALLAGM